MDAGIIDACAQMGTGDKAGDILESGIGAGRLIENMDAAGVGRSIVYTVTWDRYADRANQEIREAARELPDRFIPFARVNPTQPDAEKVLTRALDGGGFRGIRLRPHHDRFQLASPQVRRVLDIARERKLPVETDGEKDRTALLEIIREYEQVPIILAHLGSFDNWEWRNGKAYMDVLKQAPNFFQVTCFEIIHFFLEEAIHRAPEKLLFGSDSPTLPPSVELKRIQTMNLDARTYAGVVGGNLSRILKEGRLGRPQAGRHGRPRE